MKTASTVVRVVENREGGWDIQEPGRPRAVDHCAGMDEAVLKAGAMMLHGGVVRIVDRGGFVVETRPVRAPGDNPWWYLPQGPLFWIAGGMAVLQAVLGMVTHRGDWTFLWVYVVLGLLGIAFIVNLLFSRRRDRRLAQSLD